MTYPRHTETTDHRNQNANNKEDRQKEKKSIKKGLADLPVTRRADRSSERESLKKTLRRSIIQKLNRISCVFLDY